MSRWFLIVAGFGSLFMVAGKRYSELVLVGEGVSTTRASLVHYTGTYLTFVWGVAAAVTVTAYCLWAFEVAGDEVWSWAIASVVPFVIALLRYARDIDAGRAGAPDEIVYRDHVLQVLLAFWAVLFALEAFHA